MTSSKDFPMTRREYLIFRVLESDPRANYFMAEEAVASTALAHPECDLDERKTVQQWLDQPEGNTDGRPDQG